MGDLRIIQLFYSVAIVILAIACLCSVSAEGQKANEGTCSASSGDCRVNKNYLLTNIETSHFHEKPQKKMDLMYSSPLASTFEYLTRLFYKETSLRDLFKEFYEADRRNAELSCESDGKDEEYNFIVVGGGSAGSVVANRLAMDYHNYKVLLLESGGNPFPLSNVPGLVFDLMNNPEIDWSDKIAPQRNACQAFKDNGCIFQRGKGIGGSSNLNFMVAMRGNPNDYDRWANETGDERWSYESLLPFFKKMESYRGDFPIDDVHGTDGPMNIEVSRFAPLTEEWLAVGKELGFDIKDPNGVGQEEGFFPHAFTMKDGTRFSTQRAYIYPAARRPNLTIRPYSTANKIKFDDTNRVQGVYYETTKTDGSRVTRFASVNGEVIVSAGTLGSAKLLMLSGIGPKMHLALHDIATRVDLQVGQGLQDHALFFVGPFSYDRSKTAQPNFDADLNEDTLHEFLNGGTGPYAAFGGAGLSGGALIASSFDTKHYPGLYYNFQNLKMRNDTADLFQKTFGYKDGVLQKYYASLVGEDVFFFVLSLNLPKSVGQVKLRSKNPRQRLYIDPNYLDEKQDVQTVLEGVKFALKMAETETMKKIGAKLTPELFPGCESHGNSDKDNDAYWECYIRHVTQTMWHYTSTCRMGFPLDKNTVVDATLRVVETTGLRVIDNSIQPSIVTTNTNLPAILIGEVGSHFILKYYEAALGY
ncbi:glucose dehydrogenase [FAD, quinone]-like [Bradysia coprophila]|uniref:glucose dehydrogenase [FAD, quinone]-like n=1 Tax=Bradysia coprophila TaxID=38358 RepID=UPI00187DC120|nr:glucose dehydrogenase [FAD, quinone]-like [Bradysia coprophila]